MNRTLSGIEKRIPHESLRSPYLVPKGECGSPALGVLNKNFYLCEQTKRFFAMGDAPSPDARPTDGGTNGGSKDDIGSKINRGPIQAQLHNTEDPTAVSGQSTVIEETKLLNSSDRLFSVSFNPNLFVPASRSTTCHYCGLHGSRRCGQCKQAYYCSEACQKKDWSTHSSVCKPVKPINPEVLPKSPVDSSDKESVQKATPHTMGVSQMEHKGSQRIMLSDLQSIALTKGQEIEGTVLGFKSPSEFYVQIFSAELRDCLGKLAVTLKSMYSNITTEDAYYPVKGEVCVAKYSEDQNWYRVLVLEVDGVQRKAQVLFIDFGNDEETTLNNVYPLNNNIGLNAPSAIKCSVACIVPVQGVWTEKCLMSVKQHLLGQYCSFTIVDIQPGAMVCCTVNTIIASSGKSLDEFLLEMGYGCRQSACTNQKETSKSVPILEGSLKDNRQKDQTTLSSNVQSNKLISLTVGDVFQAAVTDVQTPEDFFCQQLQDARQLAELQTALSAHYNITPPCNDFTPALGEVCCAQFTEDNQWYRASVLRFVTDDGVLVGYVDYGNFEVLSISRLRPILARFLELRWQAIRCALAGVKPSSGTWTSEAVSLMKEKVANKIITVKVVNVVESVHIVELIDDQTESVVNIARCLWEAGYGFEDSEMAIPVDKANVLLKKNCGDTVKNEWTWSDLVVNQRTDVAVCFVCSPDEFYCQVYKEEVMTALNELNKCLTEYCQTTTDNNPKLQKGDVCSAFFSGDGNWYRGLIKDITADGVARVHFVDYGNNEDVAVEKVRAISSRFLKLPFQGIRCWLSGVKPVNELWTQDAIEKLQMCVARTKLQAFPVCVTENGVGVDLIDNNHETTQIISEILIREHFALKKANIADMLPVREPANRLDISRETELKVKSSMTLNKELGSKQEPLAKQELPRMPSTLPIRDQVIKFDKPPADEQQKCDLFSKRRQSSNPNLSAKQETGVHVNSLSKSETCDKKDMTIKRNPNIGFANPPCSELAFHLDASPNNEQGNETPQRETGVEYSWKSIELSVNKATQVCILQLECPKMFFALPEEKQIDKDKLQWTMIELAEYCSSEKNQSYTPRIGQACCARYTGDNHWYRAVVLEVQGSTVKVAYADYGNVENVPLSRLLPIKASFLKLPFQIIRCSLEGTVKCSVEWPAAAVERLKSLVLDQVVTATVLRVNDNIHVLTIEKQDAEGTINVADKLLMENVASCAEPAKMTGGTGVCCCEEMLEKVGKLKKEVAALDKAVILLQKTVVNISELLEKHFLKTNPIYEE